ncbi:NF-kappa-B essential modulator [Bienertia sinuspersici]
MTEWQRHLINKLILKKKFLEVQLSTLQFELKELRCRSTLY